MTLSFPGEGRRFRRPFGFLALFAAACASTPAPAPRPDVDAAIEQAIAEKKIPGAVIWIEKGADVYTRAYGSRALVPAVEPNDAGTIYDAASITKVVATAPSIWLLIERGKLELDAPISRYLDAAGASREWRDEITVRHLLTHTSGLRPSLPLSDSWSGYDEGVRRALAEDPRNRPGAIFRYSDINYVLLGEIVRRASGEPLDVFARRNIFEPLGMRDTRFRGVAAGDDDARLAPTENGLRGIVHDPTARRMGGVAGHAGVFTTAADLAKFARAMLRGGAGVFKPETVKAMTSVQTPRGVAIRRAGGFDIDSSYSRPRGEHFPIGSFGHTGWTGGFLWIDPYSDAFYVFLSNRVHPDGKGNVVALQKTLGNIIGESVWGQTPLHAAALAKRPGGGVRWVIGGGDAQNGIDVLAASGYEPLRGLRVGLITNHTGIDRTGNPTIDLLRSAPGVDLVALFSPEHGIRGVADEKVSDDRDEVTGLPIYSLYGERRKPSTEQLASLDALVFDVQDIGARFYTYISTLGLAMEAAAESKKKFYVLDRVNPIGGAIIEGPLREGSGDFVAFHEIPIRHAMTVGELARMFREERKLEVDLTVIPVKGWRREQWQDEAGLPWINTSPNMRSLNAATLYPGIGILERALSVGRGTATPFEVLGAPYIEENVLARELTALALPGIAFEPIRFTPDASVHKGESCGGVRMTITDRRALRAVDVGISVATIVNRLYPTQFDPEKMMFLLRHRATLDAIRAGKSLDEIHALWSADFDARRAKYLLY
ncbi:MAG: DUF1343 domain-containing protein [Thermoanaerobaculia bacterium]|nr:DUF1343 domain-containing protein [Thermoanaerobaculia bacterium]